MKNIKPIGGVVLGALLLGLIPFVSDSEKSYLVYFLFLTFCHIVLTQGWNLVAGYTGQISLGTHAFFALGAYTTAMIWRADLFKWGDYYFDPVTMILSGLVPVAFALAIGIPLLSKLHGDYFALGTLGFGEILKVVFIKGGQFTGGPIGIMLPSSVYTTMKPHYWTALFLCASRHRRGLFHDKITWSACTCGNQRGRDGSLVGGIHILKLLGPCFCNKRLSFPACAEAFALTICFR